MEIEGFNVETQQIGPAHWSISVTTPDKTRFSIIINGHGNLTPEFAYHEIWKKNFKQFILELDSEVVKGQDITKYEN